MNLTYRYVGKDGEKKEDKIITEKNCTMFKFRFSKVIKLSLLLNKTFKSF